jgi:hypothetical protein
MAGIGPQIRSPCHLHESGGSRCYLIARMAVRSLGCAGTAHSL